MTLGTLPTQWKVVGSDKYGDVFWQNCPNGNCIGGQVSMWQMNGLNLANIVNLGTSANFSVAGTGDFDGNGSEDLLLSDGKGGVAIWLLNGTSIVSAGPSRRLRAGRQATGRLRRPAISTAMAIATFCSSTAAAMLASGT
jgi:hypothetical protein